MPTPAQKSCHNCGTPLPPNASSNTCPACLIGELIDPLDNPTSLDTGDLADSNPITPLPGAPTTADPREGTTLDPAGRYKILQKIGEGGFGSVYMAEQTKPVRRRVAVKILKPGMDTRQVVARFEAERQALAMMDHPNIAKVLDGGETDTGHPFFVMELVRGTPVTTFCDREQLDTRQRLNLFLQVCRAVQHAHQKGVIHRDLKPANVLVTVQDGTRPTPKVIDFGVAKAMDASLTDKTLFTRFEQMVGTPAYMAPEQAGADADALDIDTRADIYALGVLLYELLTGTTPLEPDTLQRAAFDEVRRLLRDQDAPKPSARLSSLQADRRQTLAHNRNTPSPTSLDKLLRGDLDWIVMKAIEKDRRRRYETANALAQDVEHFLADAPVEARPPSTAYRLQKFARRHKAALVTTTSILLILVTATTISTIAAFNAIDANKRASKNFTNLKTAYTDLDQSRQETVQQRNEALWNQYVARQFPIRQAWEQRNFGHLERLLDELIPAPGQPDYRGWEWTYFKDQCDQAFTTIDGRFPTWDPVGGNPGVALQTVTVTNAPPVADAGQHVIAECHNGGAVVTLDGTASSDPEGDTLAFAWSAAGITFDDSSSATPTATFPLGSHTVTLVVEDGCDSVASSTVIVLVQDTVAPTIQVTLADPELLWPPDHRMVPVSLIVVVSDDCQEAQNLTLSAAVTSSEPDDTNGDGSTTGDVDGQDGHAAPVPVTLTFDPTTGAWLGTVHLRAERTGGGPGRTYAVTCTVSDGTNTTTGTATVAVPKSQGKPKGKKR